MSNQTVRGSHCHMISCVPPSTTISSLHFSIRIHYLKVPLLATAFVCFEKGIACEEVPLLHTCLSNLFAIVTHGSIQSAFNRRDLKAARVSGPIRGAMTTGMLMLSSFSFQCHAIKMSVCSKMPRLTPYPKYIPSTYTHTSFQPPLVEDMAPAIHALVVPSAAMRPRPHKGWGPRQPKLHCLTFNFPLKNQLPRPSLYPHICCTLCICTTNFRCVGENIQGAGESIA